MNLGFLDNRKRLHLIMIIILLAGLAGSVSVYLATDDTSGDSYEFKPEDSRMFRHNLEVYGGKTSVAVSDFMVWFSELWHGRQLAYTIAFITAALCILIFLAARYLVIDHDEGGHDVSHSD
ncbi:MAG: hypothetical protein LLF86_06515 [Nitrospiraceae bacterium]|nr:hypothetical protein [Nitrospiraceae bacterium]